MLHLIKIEWLKIKKYPAFWWMFGIVLLTYPGLNYMFYYSFRQATEGKEMLNNVAKMVFGNPFAFPETWHSVAYFSSIFVVLPAILVIMLVTNEYNYKTHRLEQNPVHYKQIVRRVDHFYCCHHRLLLYGFVFRSLFRQQHGV